MEFVKCLGKVTTLRKKIAEFAPDKWNNEAVREYTKLCDALAVAVRELAASDVIPDQYGGEASRKLWNKFGLSLDKARYCWMKSAERKEYLALAEWDLLHAKKDLAKSIENAEKHESDANLIRQEIAKLATERKEEKK